MIDWIVVAGIVVLALLVGRLVSWLSHQDPIPTSAAYSEAFRHALEEADTRGRWMREQLEREDRERVERFEQMRKDAMLAQMYPSIERSHPPLVRALELAYGGDNQVLMAGSSDSVTWETLAADRKQPVDFAIERVCDYCGRKGVILLPPEKPSDYDCRGCGAALAPNPLKEQAGTWQRENALLAYSQPVMKMTNWRV